MTINRENLGETKLEAKFNDSMRGLSEIVDRAVDLVAPLVPGYKGRQQAEEQRIKDWYEFRAGEELNSDEILAYREDAAKDAPHPP